MAALTFKISAELEAAGFKQAADYMKQLGAENDRLKTSTAQHSEGVDVLKGAYEALEGLGIVEFYKLTFEAAAEAREQQIQLGSRVEQTGLKYEAAKPKLDAFFEALTNQSGIAKDKLIPAFDFLIDRTNSVRTSQELMTTVMGFARARGLDLASAADLVAGAYNGQQRSILQLSRILGLTTEQAKDHVKVLEMLKDRYSGMATQTDQAALAQGRLMANFKELQVNIGEGLVGPLTAVTYVLNMIVVGFKGFAEAAGVAMGAALMYVANFFDAIDEAVKGNFSEAKRMMTSGMGEITSTAASEFEKIGDAMNKALHPEKIKAKIDDMVDQTKKGYQALNAEEQKMILEGSVAAAMLDKDKLATKLALIDFEASEEKKKIKELDNWKFLNAKDQAALMASVDEKARAARGKAAADYAKIEVELSRQVATSIGKFMADAMTGQQDSWKGMLKAVIQAIAQAAEGYVAVWAGAEVMKDLAQENYSGAAKAAAIGGLAVGVIEGLSQAAQSAIGGSGSGSSSGGGGGGGLSGLTSTSTAATPATPAPTRSTLTVIVQGDVVDSDTFMNNLAAKLSDKVENQDVKLVSSSVKA